MEIGLFVFTYRILSMGEGDVFTPVCHSIRGGRRCGIEGRGYGIEGAVV